MLRQKLYEPLQEIPTQQNKTKYHYEFALDRRFDLNACGRNEKNKENKRKKPLNILRNV